jgi:hypothetical protein
MHSHTHTQFHSHDILDPSRIKSADETIAALKLIKKAIKKHNGKAINKKKPLELIEQLISLIKKYPSLEKARQLIKTLSEHLKESDRILNSEILIAKNQYEIFLKNSSRESLIYTSTEQYTADAQGTIKSGCHERYVELARQLIQSLEKVETMAKMIEHIKTSLLKLNLPKNDVQSVLQDYANLHNASPGLLHHSPLDLNRVVKYLPRLANINPTDLGGPEMASFAYEIVSIYFPEFELSRQVYNGLRTWLDPYISIEAELARLQIEVKAGVEADFAAIMDLRAQVLNVLETKEGGATKQHQTAVAFMPKTEAPPSHIPDSLTVDFPADKLKNGNEIISELKDLEKKVRKNKDKTQNKKDTLIMIQKLIETIEKCTFVDPVKDTIKCALDLIIELDMFHRSENTNAKFTDLDSFFERNDSEMPLIRIYGEKEQFTGKDGTIKMGKHHEFTDLALKVTQTHNEFTAFALKFKHTRARLTAIDFKNHAQAIRLAIAAYEDILYGKYRLDSYIPGFAHNDPSNMTQFNIALRNYYVAEYAVCKAVQLGLAQCLDPYLATRAENIRETIEMIGKVNECFRSTLDARGKWLKAMKQYAIQEMLGEPLTPQSNPAAFFPTPPPRANTPASITSPPVVTKPKVAPQKYLPVPAVPPKAIVQTYISVPAKPQDVKSSVPATAAPQAVATPPVKTSTLVTSFYAKKAAAAKAAIPPPKPLVKMANGPK